MSRKGNIILLSLNAKQVACLSAGHFLVINSPSCPTRHIFVAGFHYTSSVNKSTSCQKFRGNMPPLPTTVSPVTFTCPQPRSRLRNMDSYLESESNSDGVLDFSYSPRFQAQLFLTCRSIRFFLHQPLSTLLGYTIPPI
jgi:hypothetical protein